MPKAYLHIGFHKTGSTSAQKFFDDNRAKLQANGIAYFDGHHNASNHVELHLACMRPHRQSPFRLESGIEVGPEYVAATAQRLREFAASARGDRLLFSAEGLSYLRHGDELCRLRELIGVDAIGVIACLREPRDWLKSYAQQMKRHRNVDVTDKDAFDYVGPDTWLLDYQARLEPFRREFGQDNVHVIDYDKAVRQDTSIIPSILDVLSLRSQFTTSEWQNYWENRSG